MSDRRHLAQQALIALSASVSLGYAHKDLFATEMRHLLLDCEPVPDSMRPLVVAASEFAHCNSRLGKRDIASYEARLRYEVAVYYARAAGNRLDLWREARGAA